MKNSGILLLIFPVILAIVGIIMLRSNNKLGIIFWVMAVPMFIRGLENNRKK